MKKLIAFHGDPKLKKLMVKEIKWHQEQDKIKQGHYAFEGKFCAVGCSIKSLNQKLGKNYSLGDHSIYEEALGIPRIIAKLEDRIFERLEEEDAKKIPLQFIKAVPVGANLEMVWPKLVLWLLVDEKAGVINFSKNHQTKKSIQDVANLYKRKIDGEKINIKEWKKAETKANNAIVNNADDVATVAASAAYDGDEYTYTLDDYAYVAADSAAARKKIRKLQAKKLLELLKSAPVSNDQL